MKHILEEPTLATKYLITSAQHSFRMEKTDFAWKFKDTSEIIELLHPRNQAQCPTQVFENQNYILKNPEDNNYTPCENQPFVGFQYPAFKNPQKVPAHGRRNPNILIAGSLLPWKANKNKQKLHQERATKQQ